MKNAKDVLGQDALLQPSQAGAYSVAVANAGGTVISANAQLSVTVLVPLAEAVDTPDWTWTTGGFAPWAGDTIGAHDTVDAGRSGTITNNQETWAETILIGPGSLNFWWKVSSETNNDLLRLYLDGSEQARLSGTVDWNQRTISVPVGSHALRWRYDKNGSVTVGQDRGWLDQVLFQPAPPVLTKHPSSQDVDEGTATLFNVAASGTPPLSYQWRRNGTNLVDNGSMSGATTATLNLPNVQRSQAGTYSVMVRNGGGSATSFNALLSVVPLLPLADACSSANPCNTCANACLRAYRPASSWEPAS
jgi:hypothetical protein